MANIHYPDPNSTSPAYDITIPGDPNQYSVAATTIGPSYSLDEDTILRSAKQHLYQKSQIIDMVEFDDAIDEATLKDNIRANLSHQMANHLTENLNFTRMNDLSNNTMTINARCYVFTREQLIDYVKGLL